MAEYYHVVVLMEHIELVTDIEPHVWLTGDREKLSELITNLVSNSMKYMGNEIEGRERKIIIGLQKHEDSIVVSVSDTGIGIKENDMPRIFDRFFRTGNSGHSHTTGTGLGLAIAKRITELHGGTITANSIFNKGTSIRVAFPATHNE